jgi:hypothetical protein
MGRLPSILAVLAAAAAVALLAGVVNAQQTAAFNVTQSKLVLTVYDDGAVQLHYTAHAILAGQAATASPTMQPAGGSIRVTYRSTIEEDVATTRLKASGEFIGGESGAPTHMDGVLHVRYARGEGNLTLILTGSDSEGTFNITLRDAKIKTVDGKVLLTGYLYASPAGREANATLPLPSEINTALEQQGITYLRVLSLNRTIVDNTVKLGFTVELDLKALAAKLSENMEPEKARELQRLLSERPPLKSYRLDASFTLHSVESILKFSLDLESRTEGNMTAYIEYSGKLNSLLSQAQTIPTSISLPKGGQAPQTLMIIAMLQKLLQNPASGKLVPVPPSTSTLELTIDVKGNKLVVDVDYTSHRQAAPGIVDPSERAEKTLTILSLGISYYRQTLQSLAAFLPGLDQLVPGEVELRPASPAVKLPAGTLSLDRLATVSVEIQKTQTSPPKPSPTATATPTAPPTTAAQQKPTAAQPAAKQPTKTGSAGGGSKYTLTLVVSAATLVAVAALLAVALRRR